MLKKANKNLLLLEEKNFKLTCSYCPDRNYQIVDGALLVWDDLVIPA
jgi:hypothetical protein